MSEFLTLRWKIILLSRVFTIGLLYSSPIHGEVKDCSNLKNDCEYYSCVEANRDCGRFGYPEGFGKKYCLRFESKKDKFSSEGWGWIEKTRNCLIQKLSEVSNELSCRKLKKQSFKDHISCYIDGGFCNLSKSDKKNIYKVALPSLWRGKSIRAGLNIKKHCRQIRNLKSLPNL